MLKNVASTVRGLAADMVQKAASGHPGMPLGCAEIGAHLFGQVLQIDATKPDWPNRDRFVLSAGHGSALLYSLLHLTGFSLTLDDLKEFRQLNSYTPGHPEYGLTPGVETTTGPLGQGMANAVGMALGERILASRYNTSKHPLINHYTYTLISDGCMMEGITAEAASLAGHLGLGKLIAIYDDNEITIAGSTSLTFSESPAEKFASYGWHVIPDVDGHHFDQLEAAILKGKNEKDRPTLIIAKIHIAKGAPTLEDSNKSHGAPLGVEEVKGLKKKMGFPVDQDFYIPKEVSDFFKEHREEMKKERETWEALFKEWGEENPTLLKKWNEAMSYSLPENLMDITGTEIMEKKLASREASGIVLNKLAQEIDYLIGGSADLEPSNKSYLEGYPDIVKGDYQGRNIRFGIREHAMAGICNGLSLYGGVRPFAATFLVFSDYMRPAIRLAALMGLPVIYIFTHDSIFVGEDGPTHQPVEQLEALRLIPNLTVIRPADSEETRVAWIEALKNTTGPTALILSRQGLPLITKARGREDFQRGAFIVKEEPEAQAVILASGSEVSLAIETAQILAQENILVQVVSAPNREAFYQQDAEYQEKVLGSKETLRLIIEAGRGVGWYPLLREGDLLISIEEFGMSAPYQDLQTKYGLRPESVAQKMRKALGK